MIRVHSSPNSALDLVVVIKYSGDIFAINSHK